MKYSKEITTIFKMNCIVYAFVAFSSLASCSPKKITEEDHIKRKEFNRGNNISDVTIFKQKKYVENYRIYYYRGQKDDFTILEDSIQLADLGEGKLGEIPW